MTSWGFGMVVYLPIEFIKNWLYNSLKCHSSKSGKNAETMNRFFIWTQFSLKTHWREDLVVILAPLFQGCDYYHCCKLGANSRDLF